MKICPNCGAANADTAKFCSECATMLTVKEAVKTVVEEVPKRTSSVIDAGSLARSIMTSKAALQGKRKADILFVLDCTGSMQGEINAIRDAIAAFADTIDSDGVRARVGLIEFRDRLIGEEHRVLKFGGEVFTNDPSAFRREVAALQADGGGDEPESSLDALMFALRQPFAADGNKVIVLVTDAPPHIPDKETKNIEQVVDAIRSVGINQLYLVMNTKNSASQVYLKLLEATRGMAFDLGTGDDFRSRTEDFKRTLMALGKTISAATR